MRVLFITNIPSPYRVEFFNELSKYCNITVAFEGKKATDRDSRWSSPEKYTFNIIQLNGIRIKSDAFLSIGITKILRKKWDAIVVCGYSTPTDIIAIEWLRLHKIPFYIEIDGAFIKQEKKAIYKFKRHLISSASGWFSSGDYSTKTLIHYGAKEDKCYKYPFSSMKQKELNKDFVMDEESKSDLKKKLGLSHKYIVLSVGRFSYDNGYGKGFDSVLKIAKSLKNDEIGFYIVGDEPTAEFRKIQEKENLTNVSFIGFKSKSELSEYYQAADIFILMTRGDVWGLVINEAMTFGLPIITTSSCIAGIELVNSNNGYIVDSEDIGGAVQCIKELVDDKAKRLNMSKVCIETISAYTIENMAESHIKVFLNKNGKN